MIKSHVPSKLRPGITVAVTESILNEGCQNRETVTQETDAKISKQSITEEYAL